MLDDSSRFENERIEVTRLVEEIVQLQSVLTDRVDYFGEFLSRVLKILGAPAGAVWMRTSQANLQLLYQINFNLVGLDKENCREEHNSILRAAAQGTRTLMIMPNQQLLVGEMTAINSTIYVVFLAPLMVDGKNVGLVEVFQNADRSPTAQNGFFQFIEKMATLASNYLDK